MIGKRHKYRKGVPTATFEELTYPEQAKAINTSEINLKKMEAAHKRKGKQQGRC